MDEDFLRRKLQERADASSLRQLRLSSGTDLCSNDYLGIVKNNLIHFQLDEQEKLHGSTGSRLISGNYALLNDTEALIASFHHAETALMFNSGYDANLGLLASVPQRGDTILYDQLSHASIRDGARLSIARSYSFAHNDTSDLEKKLQEATGRKFVVTESVFSMDGDLAPLEDIFRLCEAYNALPIVDEAHATGVIGERGEGLVQHLHLEKKCFARVPTFGKALGCHGAVILGSAVLRDYLINFCRPFIYTTAIPASLVMAAGAAYSLFPLMKNERECIRSLAHSFISLSAGLSLCGGATAIQGVVIPGNEQVRAAAAALQSDGMDVRPILYPTVPRGLERLRIVLHAFNSEEEVVRLTEGLRRMQGKSA